MFGDLFFPGSDPLTGTLQAFGTYAVGYVSRPLGGIVFGRLGDRIGRKKVLVATLLLIGVATFFIGLLPTHAQAGAIAPALLVLLRFAQGVGVGGEWGGAVLLSSEFSEPGRRGFWASAAQIGPPLGTLMANGVLAILAAALTEDAFPAGAGGSRSCCRRCWSPSGCSSGPRLEETPVFRELQERGDRPAAPVTEVLRTQTRPLIAAMLARVGPDVLYAMFAVFVLTYATQKLGMSRGLAVTAVLIGSAFQVGLIPLAGYVSDLWGRRLVYAVGAIGGAIWSVIFFAIADGGFTSAARRRRGGPVLPLADVRAAGGLRLRAVPRPAALHRQLAGLHLRRHHRRSDRPAGLHLPAGQDRNRLRHRRLHRGRLPGHALWPGPVLGR